MSLRIVGMVVWLIVCITSANFFLPDVSLIFFDAVSAIRAAVFILVFITPLIVWFYIDTASKKRREE
jgi:hypothetical protein